jgi:hypothetical protein
MRPSVQMYTLVSENNAPLRLRQLSLEMPLKCKKAEGTLTPLSAQAVLEIQGQKSPVTVQLDPNTLAVILKGNGSKTYTLKSNNESLRLKRHLLQCWITLLRARQIKLDVDHQTELEAAQKELKALAI